MYQNSTPSSYSVFLRSCKLRCCLPDNVFLSGTWTKLNLSQPQRFQEGTWRIGKLSMDIMSILTPSTALSRTALSSKTSGRDLEDRWILDEVPDVGSLWNFQKSFLGTLWLSWYHFQLHQEHSCPPRLQEETWRIGGVLMRFLMLDLDETFREAF